MKCGRICRATRKINRWVLKYRHQLFFCIVIFLVATLSLLFFRKDLKDYIIFLWTFLSLAIASLIFLQMEEYRQIESHEDLIKFVTGKVNNSTKAKTDLVIITPNLNLGQSTMLERFNRYKEVINEKQIGKIYFYLICDDSEYRYDKFDLNDTSRAIGSNIDSPYQLPDHLMYVRNLFIGKSSKSEDTISPCDTYNQFVNMLSKKKDNIIIKTIKDPFKSGSNEIDRGVFMLYDGVELLAYKVNENGLCINIVETNHKEICNCLLEVHNQPQNNIS